VRCVALNAQPDTTPRTALAIAYLGQPIFGHQAPNGYPETGDAWMNTGAILNRINFGMAVAANRLPGVSFASLPALDTLQNASRNPPGRCSDFGSSFGICFSGYASSSNEGEEPARVDDRSRSAKHDGAGRWQMEPMDAPPPRRATKIRRE
jgi:hypothetical protein